MIRYVFTSNRASLTKSHQGNSRGVNFRGVNCRGVNCRGSIVVLSPIFRDNWPQCNYIGGQLSGGQLSGVNCRGVNCRGVKCHTNPRFHDNWPQCNYIGGQLSGGQLSGGQLSGGQLSGGQLSGGQLSRYHFRYPVAAIPGHCYIPHPSLLVHLLSTPCPHIWESGPCSIIKTFVWQELI